jgi:cell division protein FtsB
VKTKTVLRAAGRGLIVGVLALAISMIAVQYARMAHRNLVLAHALWSTQSEIARLQTERERRVATIKRLEDPHGAIPEIHDRLHLVLPDESIIYLKPPGSRQ